MIELAMLPRFPCRWDNKKPANAHGFKEAAVEVDHSRWQLVGVATGAVSGIDVLDVDPRHGGHLWLQENAHRLPLTRMHRTRGGGWHFQFDHAEGLRCSEGRIADGVDVRADSGYVIWWPREGLEFKDHPLAEWPEWLLELARRPANDGTRGAAPLHPTINPEARAKSLASVVLQKRDEPALYWAACRFSEMVEWGFPRERAIKILRIVASASRLGAEPTITNGLANVERRISGLVQTVATAEEGQRNKTMYWVAIELMALTSRAEQLLIEASAQCGLELDEVRSVIVHAGERNPCVRERTE